VHVPAPEQNDAGCSVDPLHDVARPHDTVAAASWQPPAPLQAPVLPQGGAAGHCPERAAVPAAMLAHVPALPVRLHAWQVPQLGLPQQTPSTQLPLMHWLAATHCTPFGFSVQLRFGAVPWQVNGARQSLSAVHVVRQAAPLHAYGEQLDVVTGAHVPVPVQCEIGVNVEPVQDAAPQGTVAAALRQAPAPLQAPVLPHGGLATQPPRGSAVPIGTGAQLPALVPTLHAWHRPHAVLLQQTPSTQLLPVRHWSVAVHVWPSRFLLPQRLVCLSQIEGARQSLSVVHAARHAVVPLQT